MQFHFSRPDRDSFSCVIQNVQHTHTFRYTFKNTNSKACFATSRNMTATNFSNNLHTDRVLEKKVQTFLPEFFLQDWLTKSDKREISCFNIIFLSWNVDFDLCSVMVPWCWMFILKLHISSLWKGHSGFLWWSN